MLYAEYYLPDINRIPDLSCAYQMRLLKQEDLKNCTSQNGAMRSAKDRKQLDVLELEHMRVIH